MGLKKADESSQSTQYGAMATFWDANTTGCSQLGWPIIRTWASVLLHCLTCVIHVCQCTCWNVDSMINNFKAKFKLLPTLDLKKKEGWCFSLYFLEWFGFVFLRSESIQTYSALIWKVTSSSSKVVKLTYIFSRTPKNGLSS